MPNVIVTGGGRGLGLGGANELSAAGHDVIALARLSTDALSAAMEERSANGGGSIEFVAFDLSCTREIPELVKEARKTYGPIFWLVNNAGIGTSGVLATMKDADIEQLLRINTLAPLLLTKYVV